MTTLSNSPTPPETNRRPTAAFLRDNGLSLVLLAIFLLTLAGQAIAGRADFNDEQRQHGLPPIAMRGYLIGSHFWQAVAENCESEFLQMSGFVLLTVVLYQKGSPESNDPHEPESPNDDPAFHRNDPNAPWAVRRGGWILKVYSHSLSLLFLVIFIFFFVLHAFAGHLSYAHAQLLEGQRRPTLWEYVTGGRFWFESMQNWQSEFLSLFAMVYCSVRLRERGSAESKKVASSHDAHE